MEHKATIEETKRFPNLPWEAKCSCGTGGSFKDEGQAVSYMNAHHQKGSSMDTHELVIVKPKIAAPVMEKPQPVPAERLHPVVPKTEHPIESVVTPQQEKPVEAPSTGHTGS